MFNIVRFYFKGGKKVVKRGVNLVEARAHCNDPETSSSTCTTAKARAVTRRNGPWFDGYEKCRR